MRTRFCTNCQSLMLPGSTCCTVCGRALSEETESKQTGLSGFLRRRERPEPAAPVYQANSEAPYMPYKPREGQLDIILDIRRALDDNRHIVMESGTGTGKTIVSLAATLEHAERTGKKIVYLTRTISQSDQVMKELKAVSTVKPVSGMTLTGRNKSCRLFTGEEYEGMSPSVLSMMCEDRKSRSNRGQAGGCIHYDRTAGMLPQVTAFCKESFPTSAELDAFCAEKGICPYEVRRMLMKDFDVVVAPYIHILSEDIRTNFITNLGGEDVKIALIVDEAHNLIDAARQQESFRIPMQMIAAAIDECSAFRKPELHAGVVLDDFLKQLRSAVRQLAVKYLTLGSTEAALPPGALEDLICERFRIDRAGLEAAIDRMILLGEERTDMILGSGEQRMSPVYTVAAALKDWTAAGGDRHVKAVKADDNGEYLSATCIDPHDIVMFMRGLDSALHMSGTLQPLEQYHKIMGLPSDTLARTYPSPFPPGNRSVVYVDDLTTKYDVMQRDKAMSTKIVRRIAALCNAVDRNTIVFFPSYRLMNNMRPFLERDVKRALYWEEAGQPARTMRAVDIFRKGSGGVFFCVIGGSVAEGMDFPGDELSFAILVGIQFPPPSLELKAMGEMYDRRYGRGMGWKYLQETPAIRKMRQAVGRLIRTETDRGMAVILDSRAARYRRQLEAKVTDDAVRDATGFFRED
jgi:DNA excision repair protein ERCC-2